MKPIKKKKDWPLFFKKVKKGAMIVSLSIAAICFVFGMYFTASAKQSKNDLFHYQISAKQFTEERKSSSEKIEYVLFFKPTCPACHEATPLIEEVVKKKNMSFKEVDVTGERELISSFNLKEVPTLVKFVDGKEVDREVGVSTEYDQFITNELEGK